MKPFCFVLMPFGSKPDETGRMIDFDRVYGTIIEPAIREAGMDPIRADQETGGGIIHKAMFERLMLCDYAIADLTTANANVFYELGIRHGVRPHSTLLLFAQGSRLPFDVAPLRGLPYTLDAHGHPLNATDESRILAERLEICRTPEADSPLFQLVSEWPKPDIARLKTDRFRELVTYSRTMKRNLEHARKQGADAIASVEAGIRLEDADPAILVDILLSYRAVEAFQDMADFVDRLPAIIRTTVLVQEQLGFALNRLGRRDEAERVLKEVIDAHGISTETNGLLGRVYKDCWDEARDAGRDPLARGYLKKAIETYLAGFEADWRDAYPGINAVTLMEMTDPADARQAALIPVVRFAVERRVAAKQPDYWDHATLLELAILAGDHNAANDHLSTALAAIREPWEPKTTSRNLRLIAKARSARGEDSAWIEQMAATLTPDTTL